MLFWPQHEPEINSDKTALCVMATCYSNQCLTGVKLSNMIGGPHTNTR